MAKSRPIWIAAGEVSERTQRDMSRQTTASGCVYDVLNSKPIHQLGLKHCIPCVGDQSFYIYRLQLYLELYLQLYLQRGSHC